MSAMMLNLQKSGDQLVVQIGGKIDEDADFGPHSLDGAAKILVDFEKVQTINSCGIREWVKWTKTNPTAKFTYRNCPKVIVDQINMVDGFLPANGTVESFYVPYYNDDSGSEKSVLFTKGKEFAPGKINLPSDVKDDKGQALEIDVIESKYFKFVEKLKD
jgi:hypothetical protein